MVFYYTYRVEKGGIHNGKIHIPLQSRRHTLGLVNIILDPAFPCHDGKSRIDLKQMGVVNATWELVPKSDVKGRAAEKGDPLLRR
jgi:hypothetical protein